MGKKITIKIIDQKKEFNIRIRENMTMNNLKMIIEGIMQRKLD